jgi:protease I
MKALIISADNFEDSELLVPFYRLKEEELEVHIASMKKGKIRGKHGYEAEVDKTLEEINPDEYEILILPGGKAPAAIRKEKKALDIARDFFNKDKSVSAICHGPQTLITATCYKSVAQEMRDAGVLYEDREVVVDGNLVTSRQPSDLPYFIRETMKNIKKQ